MTDEKIVLSEQLQFNDVHVYVSNAVLPGKEYGWVYGLFVMHSKMIDS